jgi:predicted nucleotidyltransferase
MFGLSAETLAAINTCLQQHPEIVWAKIYGSRAKGNHERGSDIDLAFSSPTDCSAGLLEALDNLPTPYLFDVTHYESLKHEGLKEHIDRVGVEIYAREAKILSSMPNVGEDSDFNYRNG